MGETKKEKKDLISFSELAKKAGVNRSAVTAWVKTLEKSGVFLTVRTGRKSKSVDQNNALVKAYIQNSAAGGARPKNGAAENEKAGAHTVRKIKNQIKTLEISTQIASEKYIPLSVVETFLSKIAELETEIFTGFPRRVIENVEKELKIKMPAETRARAEKMLNEVVGSCIESTGRLIKTFEEKNARKTTGGK